MDLHVKLQAMMSILARNNQIIELEKIVTYFSVNSIDKPIKNKQIFFEFYVGKNVSKELTNKILEQLEISLQILINKGYKIDVYNSKKQEIEMCKQFVEVFKSESIEYIGNIENQLEISCIVADSQFVVAMSEEYLLNTIIMKKPFIAIIMEDQLLHKLEMSSIFIKKDEFNVGTLIAKIKYVEDYYLEIQSNIIKLSEVLSKEILAIKHEKTHESDKEILHENKLESMETYKHYLKQQIESLVEQGLLREAKEIIAEYEQIVRGDIDIYSIKGIIAMMEEDIDNAEEILKEGLEIQPFNFDILHNIAFLYENSGRYITAYRYYKKLLKVCSCEMITTIENKIEELEEIECVKDYTLRKKVLFIAHIFPPLGGSGVQRSLKFVKYLRDFGWEPVVITVGKTRYPFEDETMMAEIPDEVEVIRFDEIYEINSNDINDLIQIYFGVVNDKKLMEVYIKELNKSTEHMNKLLFVPDSYILWAVEVLHKIHDKVDFTQIDMIYSTSGPYSGHIIGYYLKQIYNKGWVADFRDEWTNNPYINIDKNHIVYKMNFAMEHNIVNKADKIITVTSICKKNYEKIFRLQSYKVEEITNGYDEEDFVNLETNTNAKFTMIHNGMLYMIRTPEIFMKALANLIKNKKVNKEKIRIIFGVTENAHKWIHMRNELELKDIIEFKEYMSHEDSLKLASSSDALLLIVGSGEKTKGVFTGKVFEYLRLGKPILALSPKGSLVDKLLKETGRGVNVDYNDIKGIENYIYEMYMQWEKKLSSSYTLTPEVKTYERKNLTKKLSSILSTISTQYIEVNKLKINYKEKDNAFYNNIFKSGGWNQTYFKHYSETCYYKIWLKAMELIKTIDKPQIIDIGCGPGQFANLLFDNGYDNYKGIDFSESAINYAKMRNKKHKELFFEENAYTTDIVNTDYNTVIVFEVLEHVEEDLKIISRLKRSSNILFSVPNFYSDGHIRWFNSKQEIIDRYKAYVDIEEIFVFGVGGLNKLFLVKGKIWA